ncbi:hypothetical protein LOC68_01180 [Blastopirellula sp. JC732]|uniref:Uncharacterized protein n=1 Tax=Blastopirellula sediminis TaxID=2894196 RepID=A0A9X1MJD2_9BACT|nr:hypothetical protein [Blastopirellula sediminis]MCC9608200.1 hypothetical protein [Blastopirellula sediminis]MCC9627007.1 hypothetical protein [Blastopirellula sediminis]
MIQSTASTHSMGVATEESVAESKKWAVCASKFRRRCKLDDWKSWGEYLTERKLPTPLQELVSGKKESPLAWAYLPDESIDARTFDWIESLSKVARGKSVKCDWQATADEWLSIAGKRAAERNLAIEMIAWGHALPKLTGKLSESTWWSLLSFLYQTAQDALAANFEDHVPEQFLAGELPLTLAYQFPEIQACAELAKPAAAVISDGIDNLLDGQGMPSVENLPSLRGLLACWTRSLVLGKELKEAKFHKDAISQYSWAVRQAIRVTRGDGSQVLSSGIGSRYAKHLFQTALLLADDAEDLQIAEFALPGKTTKENVSEWSLDESSYESEWAQLAILRTDWSQRSPRLAIDYSGDDVKIELESEGEILAAGLWKPRISLDGQELACKDEWQQVGWLADEDGDYLELEVDLTGGHRLQRAFFLAREDQFLIIADAVMLKDQSGDIAYELPLPLAGAVETTVADETCEMELKKGKGWSRVLPLALPEWRIDTSRGRFEREEGQPILQIRSQAKNLYAPLLFDLKRGRRMKHYTWRQLTVAENLEIQSRETAVGYRFQLNDQNWMLYRSFTEKANRTVMGVNLTSECVIARYDGEDGINRMLEIEHADTE